MEILYTRVSWWKREACVILRTEWTGLFGLFLNIKGFNEIKGPINCNHTCKKNWVIKPVGVLVELPCSFWGYEQKFGHLPNTEAAACVAAGITLTYGLQKYAPSIVGLSTSERREEIRLALGAHVVNEYGGYDWGINYVFTHRCA